MLHTWAVRTAKVRSGMLPVTCALLLRFVVLQDLKPSNFLVVKGRVVLADFGISFTVGDMTTAVGIDHWVGTVTTLCVVRLGMIHAGLHPIAYAIACMQCLQHCELAMDWPSCLLLTQPCHPSSLP